MCVKEYVCVGVSRSEIPLLEWVCSLGDLYPQGAWGDWEPGEDTRFMCIIFKVKFLVTDTL